MKAKYVLTLLAAIFLIASGGVARAQEPAPPPSADDFGNTFSFFVDGGGFLGVYGEDITRDNMAHYHLNEPRGVGITQVMNESPAQKAGLRNNDVILRLDGENVTSVRKLNRLVSEIAPDHTVKITISRNGAEQEVTATIGKRNNLNAARDLFGGKQPRVWKWEGPRNFPNVEKFPDMDKFPNVEKFRDLPDNSGDLAIIMGNSRRIGVSTMELSKQLADYFGIANGHGVLVTSVSDDGPAAKSGVKAGDVITAVDGEAVDSPGDVARIINRKKDGDVTLTVIRNKSQQTIRVTPRQGSITRTINDQVGRQIVIPHIEFPEVNIEMPRIEIPAVNIAVPRVKINPVTIRRSRGVYGPI
ncbi:MAG TPA: PDZ domain-containing protein [Pyrinomonadaceae bacterium]